MNHLAFCAAKLEFFFELYNFFVQKSAKGVNFCTDCGQSIPCIYLAVYTLHSM